MNTREVRRVLVADDEPHIRELLAMNLEAEGFQVRTAADGAEALELAGDFWPHLILLDVMMPEVDGLDVLRSLREGASTREIPVVLLSAKSEDPDIWQGWQAGADYYLTKPFDIEQLMKFLDYLEADRRGRRQAAV